MEVRFRLWGGVISTVRIVSGIVIPCSASCIAVINLFFNNVPHTASGTTRIGKFLFVFFGLFNGGANFGFDVGAIAGVEYTGAFDNFIEVILGSNR